MKTKVNLEALKKYLESIKKEDLKKAFIIEEVEHFKMDKSKIGFDQVIFYNQPFLVDAIGGDLSIAYLTKKTHTLPTGRKVKFFLAETLIEDTRKQYGDYLNGVFVIPPQFIVGGE